MFNKKLVFIAACIGMLLFGIVMLSLGTINTFLTIKYNMDELTVGSIAALLPFGILSGSLFFGPFVDRYGYKNLLIFCSLIIAICIIIIASTMIFLVLQISFFLIGFAGGAINGGTNALVSDISREWKGANLSILGVFYGIGALGMPVITAIMTKYYSYETIIISIGIIIIIPIVYFMIIRFPEPKQKQGFPVKQGVALLKEPVLILIGIFLFFESALEGVVNNWSTTFLQSEINLNSSDALFALSSMVFALTLTRLILGYLLKKFSSKFVLYISLFIIFSGLIILNFTSTIIGAITGLILLGVGFAAGFPVMLGYVGEIYAELSGTAFSIVLAIALIGNTFINYLVGIIAHSFGIKHFISLLMICVVLMTMILILINKNLSVKTQN